MNEWLNIENNTNVNLKYLIKKYISFLKPFSFFLITVVANNRILSTNLNVQAHFIQFTPNILFASYCCYSKKNRIKLIKNNN